MEHFGLNLIKKKYSLRLKREEFALINTKPSVPKFDSLVEKDAYTDSFATEYTLKWCQEYREICLENYDLNMKYFGLLDSEGFNNSILDFLKRNDEFFEIDNLQDCKNVEGYYLMVLDEYKQMYIGKSSDITRRIKQHWTKTKPFDRTLFPMYAVNRSVFSIDFFRALDTTRIFVWKRRLSDGIEEKLVKCFPQEYCTNRIGGDVTNVIEALTTLNKRTLSNE